MDENYDPAHKTSSIASNGTVPSLYSGTSTIADYDETFEGFDPAPSISIPTFEDDNDHLKQQSFRLETYFKMQCMQPNGAQDEEQQQGEEEPPTSEQQQQQPPQQQEEEDSSLQPRLTDEERRANHIASEQRRRNAIRTGFKEMTELIPTLKNIHHSKSTILFKAAEYIRQLEKRNRHLRERLTSLQLRIQRRDHHMETLSNLKHQRQVALLKEQLRIQQALLDKHNIAYPRQHNHHHQQYSSYSPSSSSSFSCTATTNTTITTPAILRQSALDAGSINIPADVEDPTTIANGSQAFVNLHSIHHSRAFLP